MTDESIFETSIGILALPSPPFVQRYLELVLLGFLGVYFSFCGLENFDKKRKIRSATLIGFGMLLCLVGLGLWDITFFSPASWGWWL